MGKKKSSSKAVKNDAEFYSVEAIVGERTVKGKIEYLVKWEGYDSSENTYEPLQNFAENPELIHDYKRMMAKRVGNTDDANLNKRRKTPVVETAVSSSDSSVKQTVKKRDEKKGFERHLAPEKISDFAIKSKKKMLLIKWKDTDEEEWVPASDAKVKCPDLVIEFYEAKIDWTKFDQEK